MCFLKRVLLLLGAALAPALAWADIYKCVSDSGHVTYSNVQQKGCQKMNLEPLSTIPPPKPAARSAATGAAQPAPGFPKVEPDAQKKRDSDRRRILEEELATEEKQLDQAKQALAEQEAVRLGDERNYQRVLDRLQPFKDKVALHERNIDALKRELSNLK